MKESHLELEVDTEFSSALEVGEHPVLRGHFCLKKDTNGNKCNLLTREDLLTYDVKFFYPDMTNEVTDAVVITIGEDRHTFEYQTPDVVTSDKPQFIAEVMNKGSKVAFYQKSLVKIQTLIEKLLARKTHCPNDARKQVDKHIATLQRIETRIKTRLQGETALIAKREFPIQVKNNIARNSGWVNAIEDWQVQVDFALGTNFEGEKSWVNLAFTPYLTNDDDWKMSFKLDGNEVKSKDIVYPAALFEEKLITQALSAGEHDLEIVISRREQKHRDKNNKWNQIYKKKYSIHTLPDQVIPEFANISPSPGRYVSRNIHSLSYTVNDLIGRVDETSIKAVFKLQNGTDLDLSSNLNYQTNGEVLVPSIHGNQTGSSSYLVSGTFRDLPEGTHKLSLTPTDFAGNEAQGAEWTLIYDRTPPLILLPFTQPYSTNEESFSLPVTIADLTKSTIRIYVNGVLQVDEVAYEGNFSEELNIDLVEGMNFVRVEATDEAGNYSLVNFPPIILDSTPPELASLNIHSGDLIRTQQFTLNGSSNEILRAVLVNGEEIDMADAGSKDFAYVIEHLMDGEQTLDLTLVDLAGNSLEYSVSYQFLLKLLDANLIAVSQIDEDHLRITGFPGATSPGIEVSAKDGFFNSGETIASEDGSFVIDLDNFLYAKVTAFDSSRDRGESAVVSFNVDTTFAGVVKDVNDNPLPGATITIASTGQSVKTDTSGAFSIPSPALGDQLITVDGRTIPQEITKGEKAFSVVSVNVSLGNKQKNILERPIYLSPKMLDGTETAVISGSGATVSSSHAPGVEIEIPANSVTFPGGSKSGSINIMEIPAEKTSVELLEEATPETVYALEPSGLEFNQRVKLTLPNNNDFPAGTELVILSKNSETGIWEVDGSANVTEANIIETKPGQGISHFSEVYAAPLGMEVKAFKDGDKPSADSMSGAVSTSVALPSFKSMGQDITPSLTYNSQWANPTIVLSNVFDLPRKYFEASESISKGGALGKVKAKATIRQWITPEYIDAQFFSSNVESEKIRFTGMPDHSLVSYQMDLGELPSGIHPAKSSYEIRFKELTIRTQKIKTKDWKGKTKTKTKTWREEKLLEEIFPQEMVTTIYHQNKKQSEFGAGWKLNLGKKILNPEQDRIMVEYENGQIGSYALKNTVETLQYDSAGIRSFTTDGDDVLGVNFNGEILRSSNGSTQVVNTLTPHNGGMGINTSWYSRRSRKCVKSGWSGCKKYEYTYYYQCNKYDVNYDIQRKVKSMIMKDGQLVYLDQAGAIFGPDQANSLAGVYTTPSNFIIANNSTGEQAYQPHCQANVGGDCSTVRDNVNSYTIRVKNGSTNTVGWCNQTSFCDSGNCTATWKASSGKSPQSGFQNGASFAAKFNQPINIIEGFTPDSLLVADYGNNLVRLVDNAAGEVKTFAGNRQTLDNGDGLQATAASVYHPRGLAVLPDGSVLIASEAGYIRKVTTDGVISTYIGKPTSKGGVFSDIANMKEVALSSPSSMSFDEETGYLYIADTGHNRILRVDLESEEARVVAGNGTCVAGDVLEGKAALEISLCRPEQIKLDSNGNLLVLDEANKRVRRINFKTPEDGLIRYQPLAKDNTELLRNQSGQFVLKMRDGRQTLFSPSGLELETSDRVGRVSAYQYDSQKRLTSATLPTGQQIQIQYSGDHLATITDVAGRMTQFNYSGDFLTSISFPDGTEKTFDYNDSGILTQETNQRGMITRYILNNWQRLTKILRPDGTGISMEDAVSKTISNGNTDGNSTELKSLESDQDSLKDIIADAKGNTTSFLRDSNGYVQEIIDAKGLITKVERDSEGRPTKIIKPDLTYTELTYNPLTGDLLKRYESGSNLSEVFSYNQYGQLLSYKDPLNNTKVNTYDPQTGLLIREIDPNGNFIETTYNSLGLIQTSSNKLGLATNFSYGPDGNIVEVTAPMGEKSTYIRDGAGNVISKTNAKSQTTIYTLDAANHLTSVKTPGNFTTSYSYLPTGELSTITNPEGFQTVFEYDELGRLAKKTSPTGQVTRLFYDNNDNVIKEITPKGDQKLFSYNELNQLIRKELPDDLYQFTYNEKGNLLTASNLNSNLEFTYVSILGEDHVKTITTSALDIPSHTMTYGYNAAGRKTSMVSNYISLNYGLDSAYRITNVANSLGQNFGFNYDEANRIVQISRPNDVNSSLAFDNNSFLKEFIHKKGSSIVESFIYNRDQIGNRTSLATTRGNFSFGYDSENQLVSASHPEADQLHALEVFTYDSLGNRTSDNQGSFSYDDKKFRLEEDYKYLYVHDLNGNLISKQEKGMSGRVWNYSYSSENQMIQAELFEGTAKLKSVHYFYDVMGRRIKKSVQDLQNSTSLDRKFIYDSSEIIAELDENGSVLVRYTHSGLRTDDVLAADISSSGVFRGLASQSGSYFYLKDGLGSVQAITTDSGNLVQRNIYSSFGKLLKTVDSAGLESTTIRTAYAFTNREIDEETGLYYYRARFYDPGTGRFLTADTDPGQLMSPPTFNSSYVYSLNNPANRVDPNGRMSFLKSLTIVIGAGLAGAWAGGAAGAAIGGPVGFVVGVVVGAVAGALTAIAINGAWNTLDKKPFFEDWKEAAIMGAISGAIAGGRAAYSNSFSSSTAQSSAGYKVASGRILWVVAVCGAAAYLFWKHGIEPYIDKHLPSGGDGNESGGESGGSSGGEGGQSAAEPAATEEGGQCAAA